MIILKYNILFILTATVGLYVYLLVAYGYPVTVYCDFEGKRFAYKIIQKQQEMEIMMNGCEIVSNRVLLSSPYMSHLKPQIIGHPNLFLKDGAFARVLSSDPSFNLQSLNILSNLSARLAHNRLVD